MSSELAISVRNLSKNYRIYEKPEHRLVQMATLGRVRPFKEFAALHDISFDMHRGETIGIVGRNGCGKSTLLQIICGTLQPSAGSIEVHGRIAALLELGAGFNGEFTGRENVYMNGAILGLSREEMDAKFEEITRFASIGDFIERPVKTYSSGMFVRLAFAVATAVEPDILVVDEALSVGDEAFQRKCFARIEALKERGGTILFVSHGAGAVVQLCDHAILLDAGEMLLQGDPRTVVSQYQRLVNLDPHSALAVREEIKAIGEGSLVRNRAVIKSGTREDEFDASSIKGDSEVELEKEWMDTSLVSQSVTDYETDGATISNIRLLTEDDRTVNVIHSRRRYRYAYDVDFEADAEEIGFGMMIKTVSGLELGGATTAYENSLRLRHAMAGARITVEFDFEVILNPGVYFMNAGVLGSRNGEYRYLHRQLDAFAFRVIADIENVVTGHVSINPRISVNS